MFALLSPTSRAIEISARNGMMMQKISRRVIYNIFIIWRRLWITSKTEFCVSLCRGSEIVMMKLVPQAHRLLHVKEQAFCEAACGAFHLSTMLIRVNQYDK